MKKCLWDEYERGLLTEEEVWVYYRHFLRISDPHDPIRVELTEECMADGFTPD